VIKFHCFSPWELACLSILPFFQDLQVIPKKEGTLFPLGATRSFSEGMLGKRDLRFAAALRYRATSEKQVTFWLNIDFHWHGLRVSLHRKQNSISSCFRRQHF
jgi:hypothetical protein